MSIPLPTSTAILLVFLLTLVLPPGLMFLLHRRQGGKWSAFAVGAVAFYLFAVQLETIARALIQRSFLGEILLNSPWLYALYCGIMAALFEETGRLLAFIFPLHWHEKPVTALAYGLGHGGCEAFLLTGMVMVNNLILLYMAAYGEALSPELAEAAEGLITAPVILFFWGAFERVFAMLAHTAFSVLVFAAVRSKKPGLFLLALTLHAAVDFLSVIAVTVFQLPTAAQEILFAACSLAIARLAARVYKKIAFFAENA